jgi:hypothetical protein
VALRAMCSDAEGADETTAAASTTDSRTRTRK